MTVVALAPAVRVRLAGLAAMEKSFVPPVVPDTATFGTSATLGKANPLVPSSTIWYSMVYEPPLLGAVTLRLMVAAWPGVRSLGRLNA
jgi:hypothetical protein